MIPKFEKGYCPNLLSWKEISNLINIRPLMSASRVRVFGEGTDTWKIITGVLMLIVIRLVY